MASDCFDWSLQQRFERLEAKMKVEPGGPFLVLQDHVLFSWCQSFLAMVGNPVKGIWDHSAFVVSDAELEPSFVSFAA